MKLRYCSTYLLFALLVACGNSPDIGSTGGSSSALNSVAARTSCIANSPALNFGSGLHSSSPNTIPAPAATAGVSSIPQCDGNTRYLFGAGKADITGPSAKINSGIESPAVYGNGIYTRLYSRSFIVQSPCNDKRMVLSHVDIGLMFESIRQEVLARLAADPELSGLYTADNVMMNASHTHSGPGGQAHHTAYNVFRFGHDAQTFEVAVDGIVRSIKEAHGNFVSDPSPGKILISQGELLDTNKNRAIPAYQNNPSEERNRFLDSQGNEIDSPRLMTLLKFVKDDGTEVGTINWFGVHPTADFYHTDYSGPTPLSGDSKGYASKVMEGMYASRNPDFVATFAQADEGDVFANLWFDNAEEDARQAAFLPANEPLRLTVSSGQKQLLKALSLYEDANELINGPVDHRLTHVQMDQVEITDTAVLGSLIHPDELDANPKRTCAGALGVSFPAGGGGGAPGEPEEGGTVQAGITCSDPDAAQAAANDIQALSAGISRLIFSRPP